MDIAIPLIPTSIWLLASSITAFILLTVLFLYLFNSRRIAVITDLEGNVADLIAKEKLLKADIDALHSHILGQKEELLRVDGERSKQETLRLELDELTRKGQSMDSQNQALRDEVGQLELEKQQHAEKIHQINEEMQAVTHQRDAAAEEFKTLQEEIAKSRQESGQEFLRIEEEHQKAVEKRIQSLDEKMREKKEAAITLMQEYRMSKERLEETECRQQDLREKIADVEARLQSLGAECVNKESRLSELDPEIEAMQRRKIELGQEIETLNAGREALCEARDQLSEIVDKVTCLEEKEQNLRTEISNKEYRLSELYTDIGAMQSQKHDLGQEVEKLNLGREELRRVRDQLSEKTNKVASLEKKEQNLQDACVWQEGLRDKLSESVKKKKTELGEVEQQLRDFAPKYVKLVQIEERQAELERAVSRLEIEEDRLQVRVNELRKELDQEAGGNKENPVISFSDLLVEPACLNPKEFPTKRLQMNESQILQEFKDQLAKEGLTFPDRVVNAFHTSLKCADINPLTVLSGVSGTGKTLLPIKYSRFMGMHSLVMAVQPRWDSPQDMFGFYNYLEKRYKPTELAQALVRMDEHHSFMGLGKTSKDRMLLVLMDEMNLARTEYYFSEFLSKLELRRDVKNPLDTSDRERAEIVLDLGPGGAAASRLWVGGNVLFVGTMNEDETTQSLSDKVLDRSNVLRFGKPAKRLTDNPEPLGAEKAERFLSHELWTSWIHPYNEQSSWNQTVANWTEEINTALQKVGRPFGYRVEKAIRAYVSNYPGVGTREVYKLAFADQIEQKILPKLRGLDVLDPHAADCLKQIQDIVVDLGDNELTNAFDEAKTKSNTNLFYWQGVSRS
ncbi:MAG: hypothetical protein PHP23_05780 [Desulfobacterales bacterium]|nr:hypothetical protein [Desulfobacterales bacterium]MDD4072317.1 hypothetical protein [Desulfobacterales bacterium]MDD4393678.1 hypothetical protein [Desulfobacterales bacterium]